MEEKQVCNKSFGFSKRAKSDILRERTAEPKGLNVTGLKYLPVKGLETVKHLNLEDIVL